MKLEKFTGKHLLRSFFFNILAGLRSATLLKKRLRCWCFPMNFTKVLRTPYFQNSFRRLPLPCPTIISPILKIQQILEVFLLQIFSSTWNYRGITAMTIVVIISLPVHILIKYKTIGTSHAIEKFSIPTCNVCRTILRPGIVSIGS